MSTEFRFFAIMLSVPLLLGCLLISNLPSVVAPSAIFTQAPSPEMLDPATVQAALATVNSLATSDQQEYLEKQSTSTEGALITQQAVDTAAAITLEVTITANTTQVSSLEATSQTSRMKEEISKLYDDGVIEETEGQYSQLEDFDESFAKLGYINWYPSDYKGNNFAISADVNMSMASDKGDYYDSACGVVFGETDEDPLDYMAISADGFAYLNGINNGKWRWLSSEKWGDAGDMENNYSFMLVVFDKRITLYFNGTKLTSAYDGIYQPGNISLSVNSGTNAGYGTRCKMTNIELWIFND